MRIGERAKAKAAGSKLYFTGRPCPRGHVANRSVSKGHCVICKEAANCHRTPPKTPPQVGDRMLSILLDHLNGPVPIRRFKLSAEEARRLVLTTQAADLGYLSAGRAGSRWTKITAAGRRAISMCRIA